jgi:hypothetical protein
MNSKYRIVRSSDPNYLYEVEKRKWFLWWNLKSCFNLEDAEHYIKRIFENKAKAGKVVREYDSHDFLIDKLKG